METCKHTTTEARLERELHNVLCDLGFMEQRMDEFVDHTEMTEQFARAWRRVINRIQAQVLREFDAGKRTFKVG